MEFGVKTKLCKPVSINHNVLYKMLQKHTLHECSCPFSYLWNSTLCFRHIVILKKRMWVLTYTHHTQPCIPSFFSQVKVSVSGKSSGWIWSLSDWLEIHVMTMYMYSAKSCPERLFFKSRYPYTHCTQSSAHTSILTTYTQFTANFNRLPSRCTCSIIISKVSFSVMPIPPSDVCMLLVFTIVKYHVLRPCVVDGRSRNPLYYYYYYDKQGLEVETWETVLTASSLKQDQNT